MLEGQKRWWALIVLCLGVLMIVLDTTIVNVALPSIRADLGFTETTLVWVVNAYMLTFGGFCSWAVAWAICTDIASCSCSVITLFTIASLACGSRTRKSCSSPHGPSREWVERWFRRYRCP